MVFTAPGGHSKGWYKLQAQLTPRQTRYAKVRCSTSPGKSFDHMFVRRSTSRARSRFVPKQCNLSADIARWGATYKTPRQTSPTCPQERWGLFVTEPRPSIPRSSRIHVFPSSCACRGAAKKSALGTRHPRCVFACGCKLLCPSRSLYKFGRRSTVAIV